MTPSPPMVRVRPPSRSQPVRRPIPGLQAAVAAAVVALASAVWAWPAACPAASAAATATAATPSTAASAPPEIELPVPVTAPSPPVPAAATAAVTAGTAPAVTLELMLDERGAVVAATTVTAGLPVLDRAALAAATAMTFTPARVGGNPVPVRIRYAVVFALPPSRSAPPAAAIAATSGAPAVPDGTTAGAWSGEALDVSVRGVSEADRLRRSARAVQVVELVRQREETADMGEVLARQEGVSVRRAGGLGSGTRFSLNGFDDDQIRFFLDGVPLGLAGYPLGVANVPVNLIDRVEVYKGVVPIRFGADALGGAVNLVTDADPAGTHGSASYQVGSFGTHRATLGVHHRHEPTGGCLRAGGFFDHADNDYAIDVEAPDDRGRVREVSVERFHDAYRAWGANLEAGVRGRTWADRLSVRGFVTEYDDEIQHNVVMTLPYGDVEFGESAAGGVLRYEQAWRDQVELDALAGYTYTELAFVDVGECIYSWYGECVRERPQPGEVGGVATDQRIWDNSIYSRTNLQWRVRPRHTVRVSVAPTFTSRSGRELRHNKPDVPDPLTAQRDLLAMVSGVEHELNGFDGRLENIAFGKSYVQLLRSDEALSSGVVRNRDRDTLRFGAGDSLRYRFRDDLYAKASYEYATRLPGPDEVFGNGGFIVANLGLNPEVSHNGNLGLSLDGAATPAGAWRGSANGFVRVADQLIQLFGNDRIQTYQNVYSARALGVEAAAGWTAPGDYVALDGNVTYVDFRNTSDEGLFENHTGDRIPNRPYLFANGSARFRVQDVAMDQDEVSIRWHTRYVHSFFRNWESVGSSAYKLTVDAQLLHALALTYRTMAGPTDLSVAGEVQNLTDEPAFDFFGVQRPGRAFYFKLTAQI